MTDPEIDREAMDEFERSRWGKFAERQTPYIYTIMREGFKLAFMRGYKCKEKENDKPT